MSSSATMQNGKSPKKKKRRKVDRMTQEVTNQKMISNLDLIDLHSHISRDIVTNL